MSNEVLFAAISMVACGYMVGMFLFRWEQINELIKRGRIVGYEADFFLLVFLVMFLANLLELLSDSAFYIPLVVRCGAMLFGLLFANYFVICDRDIGPVGKIVWAIIELSLLVELVLGPFFGVLDSFTLSIILIVELAATTLLSWTLFK